MKSKLSPLTSKTLALLYLAIVGAAPGTAAPIIRLGLYDTPYTDSTGKQFSFPNGVDGNIANGISLKFAGTTNLGVAAWVANATSGVTTRIGFFDSAYTQMGGTQSGYQESRVGSFDDGRVAGYSRKWNGMTYLGQAAWVADAITGVTTRVGLLGPEFTYANGLQYSQIYGLQNGYAHGKSDRVGDTDSFGGAAWVANVATGVTTRVGFFDVGYTQNFNNHQETFVTGFQGRYAAGTSRKYNGGRDQGRAAWVADAETGVTTRVGFFGSGFTQIGGDDPGRQFGGVLLDPTGYAAGTSAKFDGQYSNGSAAWVTNVTGGPTIRLGFFGSEYTGTQDYQISNVSAIQGGYVAGTSQKYNGTTIGQVAWVANAATAVTTRVGLVGAEFTATGGSQNGYQSSEVTDIRDGYAAGSSRKFSGATDVGSAPWVADAGSGVTRPIGLMGAGETIFDRIDLLKNGYVTGDSGRSNGTTQLGVAAWIANAATGVTTRVGLFDSGYTQSGGSENGYQYSGVQGIEGHYAYGYSEKFSGTADNGITAWIYDLDDAVLSPITLSQRASDGYSNSFISRLYDNGLALGSYTLFDGAGTDLGDRAFIWTPADGAFDLGSLIPGGLSAAGWALLSNARFADTVTGTIFGYGSLIGGNPDSLVIYAAVPEPGSVTLLFLGVALLGLRLRPKGNCSYNRPHTKIKPCSTFPHYDPKNITI